MRDRSRVLLVDSSNRVLGTTSKSACHTFPGQLHRAFSAYIFDKDFRVLLQKRSTEKPLWPGKWSNSYCSHPMPGESISSAARRRSHEELGIAVSPSPLCSFVYSASDGLRGIEYEYCTILTGRSNARPKPHPSEILECRYAEIPDLLDEIVADHSRFTPWLIIGLFHLLPLIKGSRPGKHFSELGEAFGQKLSIVNENGCWRFNGPDLSAQ